MREQIKRVLKSFSVDFTDDVVEMLMLRVGRYENVRSPQNLAHVIASNWAMSQKRNIAAAINKVKDDQMKAAKAEVARAHAEDEHARFQKAVNDFDQLVPVMQSRTPRMPQALQYMRLVCFEHKSDAECADLFPGTTRDQRYQWLKRARDLVLPKASPELKVILEFGIWNKRKSN